MHIYKNKETGATVEVGDNATIATGVWEEVKPAKAKKEKSLAEEQPEE